MSEQFSILIDSRTRFETGETGGVWLSMPTTKEQLHEAITVNVAGQVGQIRLPTSKALWPLFETVINSIQSLEESDTKKKVIVIDALRPEHTQLKTGEQGRTIMAKERMVDDV